MLLLSVTFNGLIAQDPTTNLNKYWHYRWRLKNYFMSVGPNIGQSIPAQIRNGYYGSAVNKYLYWFDGERALGWYIGVLATEYRLLKDNPNNTANDWNETVKELWYALHAVYRLDSIGYKNEAGWCNPFPGNGFMFRDDVPTGFISQYQLNDNNTDNLTLNYPTTDPTCWSGGTQVAVHGSGMVGHVNTELSDYNACTGGNWGGDNAGNDNYDQLLMGLSLVVKLVDPGVTTVLDDNGNPINFSTLYGYDLQQMAYQEGHQILDYVINGSDFHLKDAADNYVQDNQGGDALGFHTPLEWIATRMYGFPSSCEKYCNINLLAGILFPQ